MPDRTCSIPGCSDRVRARGWCNKHHYRWETGGDPLWVNPRSNENRLCSVSGCERPSRARGMCQGHRDRVTRFGHPGDAVFAPISKVRRRCSIEGCDKYRKGQGYCSGHYQRLISYGDPLAGRPPKIKHGENPSPCADASCLQPAMLLTWCVVHYRQNYHAQNPQKRRDHKVRRRSRMVGNTLPILAVTERDWRRTLAAYRNCCAYCGLASTRLQRDHVIPLARGGRHSIGNLVPACATCNNTKNDRLLVEFRYGARRRRRAKVNAA